MDKEILINCKIEYPTIYNAFKSKIINYQDFDFLFRRKIVKNIPYFKNLDDAIANDITYLMSSIKYEEGSNIVKRGQNVDSIMLLKSGEINIYVPHNGELIYLDSLNEGSCFCIYSPFNTELTQLVQFRAKTTCFVELISIKQLRELEKQYFQLSDIFKKLAIEIENGEKTDLDFFRYRPPRDRITEDIKCLIRKKFRIAVINYYRKHKQGLAQPLPALEALKEL